MGSPGQRAGGRSFSGQRISFLLNFRRPDPAGPDDLAAPLALASRFSGRKRAHDADTFIAEIVAKRLVEHLERSRFVVMKRPPVVGHSSIGRGFEG
jgi:hypothetical protein